MAGVLMVSRLAYYSGKDLNLGGRIPFGYVLLIPAIFILISLNPPTVLFLLFFGYALSAPLVAGWRLLRRRRRRLARDEDGARSGMMADPRRLACLDAMGLPAWHAPGGPRCRALPRPVVPGRRAADASCRGQPG
jgi:hypothetical protein